MARIARVVLEGRPHHVTQRGVRSMKVFSGGRDYREYLRLLRREAEAKVLEVFSWCLMPNHIHLVVTPQEKSVLAEAIGEAHKRYTRSVNFREGVRGYLFQGRFYSCPLDERHFMAAVRYVERNPVRAGLAKEAWQYAWSSAAYHVGLVKEDPLVKSREPYGLAGADDWRDLLRRDPEEIVHLRRSTSTGRPCGGASFVELAEELTGLVLHPLRPGRPPGRQSK